MTAFEMLFTPDTDFSANDMDLCIRLAPQYMLYTCPHSDESFLQSPAGNIPINSTAHTILAHCTAPIYLHDLIWKIQAAFPQSDVSEDVAEFVRDGLQQLWLQSSVTPAELSA